MMCSGTSSALLALALSSLADASPKRASYHKHSYGSSSAIEAEDFVKVDGLRLKDSKGNQQYLTGINYWACMNLAADADAGGNHSRFITELDQMQAAGINHLRIMASSEGNPEPQPFRMYPALMPSPGEWNEDIFVGLDRCLAEMSKRGMRATMTLADQWQWSGGFAQYVSWSHDNEAIAYPPSWNLSAPPQRTDCDRCGWGDYSTGGDWNEYVAYGDQFYTDEQAETWFKEHIDKVLYRKNTVNGRVYKEDATVMTWELANEPQPAVATEFLGPYGLQLPPNPDDPLLPWIDRISTYIRGCAPKQLITTGFEGKQGEWYWKKVHEPKNIDYATSHLWVQNWGVYDMLNSSDANLQNAKNFAQEFVSNTSRWGLEIGKPVYLEEFGMARDNWENNVTAGEYLYASKATTTHKDSYFNYTISLAVDSFKSNGSYIGTSPWAYGGVYRPETQHENEFGQVWAGDPPHESPGWYDVYDSDYALTIIYNQYVSVKAFLSSKA